MGKVRYKSRAARIADRSFLIGETTDGYMMLSKDGGRTFDTVFDADDNIARTMAGDGFVVEAYEE